MNQPGPTAPTSSAVVSPLTAAAQSTESRLAKLDECEEALIGAMESFKQFIGSLAEEKPPAKKVCKLQRIVNS